MTNSLHCLPHCDRVVYLEDGRIVEQGGFDELRRANGPFAGFLSSKQKDDSSDDGDTLNAQSKDDTTVADLELINIYKQQLVSRFFFPI